MENAYQEDLAYIHDAGFGHLATHAAALVIDALRRGGIDTGLTVDLGCGSGISSRLLCDAGYDVVGIDLSEPLLKIARKRAPRAVFRCGSFATTDLPPCVAVTAIGEVFNYSFDAANTAALRTRTFSKIYQALAPGGLFVFDMAGPARVPSPSPQRTFAEGPDWAVLVEAAANQEKSELTRRIAAFRRVRKLYRRTDEIHCLQLVDPADLTDQLQHLGFSVQELDCYGALQLPSGLTAFIARKPSM